MPSCLRQNTRSKFWRLYTNATIATEMSRYKYRWKEWIKPTPFLIVGGFLISGIVEHDNSKSVRSDLREDIASVKSDMVVMEERLTNVIRDDKSDLIRLIAKTDKAIDRTDKLVRENAQAIRDLTAISHEILGYLKGRSGKSIDKPQ